MRNKFFREALQNAAGFAGRRGRLLALVSRLSVKLKDVNWSNVSARSARDKLHVLGRLVRAYATGEYRQIPWKTVLLITAAILYFVNPLDLIPDLIPLTGLTDDFGILVWVFSSIKEEIDKFISWEKSQITT